MFFASCFFSPLVPPVPQVDLYLPAPISLREVIRAYYPERKGGDKKKRCLPPFLFGEKACTNCHHVFPYFPHFVGRRTKKCQKDTYVNTCGTCRANCRKSHSNPDTKSGELKAAYTAARMAQIGRPCAGCAQPLDASFHFDHIIPATKSFACSHWMRTSGMTLPRLEAELAKCQPLCAPCHTKKTAAEVAARVY